MPSSPQTHQPSGSGLRSALTFIRGVSRQPGVVASIIPSSDFLKQRLCQNDAVGRAKLIVELGPGTGGTTRALLQAMRDDAQLLAVELVPEFARQLQTIDDPRLRVHCGDASQLTTILGQYAIPQPEVIISGIPFSTMDAASGRAVIAAIHAALPVGGTFLAYQVRDRISEYAGERFEPPQVSFILLNFPPLRLYCWKKAE